MNARHYLNTTLAVAALLSMSLAHAANIGKAEYKSGKDNIAATYKSDKAACATMSDNAKDICMEEAKGKDKIAKAELEYSYTGKPKDQIDIAVARADSSYAVAMDKCDDLKGNPKDVCVKEAKAMHVKGLADAKVVKVSGDTKRDAATDKRDADYKVAAEKCDALASDAKTACVSQAKSRFGKS